MLDNLNLIHMNGRVYDNVIGRFTSADPFIPDAGNSQEYNRYTYVRNTPTTLVDPSGFDDCPGPCWLNPEFNDPSVTIYYANGLTYDGGRGWAGNIQISLDTGYLTTESGDVIGHPNIYNVTAGAPQFTETGALPNLLDCLNANTGKFSSAWDGYSASPLLISGLTETLGSFSLHVQNAWNQGLITFRNGAIINGAAMIAGAGIGAVMSARAAAQGTTVFAGHGIESALAGTTVVPEGVALTLPGKAGLLLPDSLGQLIEGGNWATIAANPEYAALMEGSTTFLPGATVPNLILQPAADLAILPGSVTVTSDTTLAELLSGARGLCVWAACR